MPAGLAEEYRRPGPAFLPADDLPPSVLALAWDPRRTTDAATRLARLAGSRRES
ncbi:hypothetical protein K1X13_01355 [Nocardioides sp. WL0053]|uniref:LysR substrate binding domain-containing protein n=1 Tax=Nocardioides jiangsuensis TaxID=2866161 RepID=A0ABS7REK3_9ACTN|nr:hypothetical protein [Nocardioides jiangsuensis]MBY9073456.1 hypothetical protein [Nocardioides jiangsuensis]